jgi:tryptophan synthase alpha chain
MSRIAALFERLGAEERMAFCGYLTVGYPTRDATPGLVAAVTRAGVDMVELGLPFSDPLAEGRTIQRTSQAALRNGVTTAFCLETARRCRALTEAPLVLMGYVNPLLSYGYARFCADAAAAGVDGLIVVDLAQEEAEELHRHCQAAGLDLIFLLAPTSTERRIETVARLASGFVYCVAVTGVTGSREALPDDLWAFLDRVRERVNLPLGLGFGLSQPAHLARLAGKVEAAIVGSALLDAITDDDPGGSAAAFVKWILSGAQPREGAAAK